MAERGKRRFVVPDLILLACVDPVLAARARSACEAIGLAVEVADGPGSLPERVVPAALVEVPLASPASVPLETWRERASVLVLVPDTPDPELWARCLAQSGARVLPSDALHAATLRPLIVGSGGGRPGTLEDEQRALRRRIRHDLSTPFRQITAISELVRLAHSRGDQQDLDACLSLLEQAAREGTELVERLGAEPAREAPPGRD